MKKNRGIILSFLLGAFIFGTIGVVSSYAYLASNVEFSPVDTNWNVDNAEDAINDLYNTISGKVTPDAKKYLFDSGTSVSLVDILSSMNVCMDSTRMNNILSNSTYTEVILSNTNTIKALDSCSPKVSTDTSKVYYSSQYNSDWSAASAFGASGSGWSVGAGVSYKNQYIGYDFSSPVWLYKMVVTVSDGKQNTDYVLEGSNDKSSYTILKDGLHQGGGQKTIYPINHTEKYRYYRIRLLSTVAQSGSGNTIVSYLRFYAK